MAVPNPGAPMILGSLTLLLGVICIPLEPVSPPMGPDAVSREALYRQGITFEVFLDQAVRRRERWLSNHGKGTVPDDLLQRARAVPGRWRLLAVAVDSCSDSVNTVPYLAHLVDAIDGLEMRIIDPNLGRGVMEAHRTPDGRPATPTIVLLNEDFEEVGCFVERPRELQAWALANRAQLDGDTFLKQKFAWYDEDMGRQTMSEIIELLEAAAQGATGC